MVLSDRSLALIGHFKEPVIRPVLFVAGASLISCRLRETGLSEPRTVNVCLQYSFEH